MNSPYAPTFEGSSAYATFAQARRLALWQALTARLTGRRASLCSLQGEQRLPYRQETRDIPLDAVVGSVGRAGDFSHTFLPKHPHLEARWRRVWALMDSSLGTPPIEVYQVGRVYFVLDGHHRVSVARWRGFRFIEAHVTELRPLEPPADIYDASSDGRGGRRVHASAGQEREAS